MLDLVLILAVGAAGFWAGRSTKPSDFHRGYSAGMDDMKEILNKP